VCTVQPLALTIAPHRTLLHLLQAHAMQQALEARKVELRRLQAAAKTAAAAASIAKDAYIRAKDEATVEHPLDDEARRRFEQMPDDRWGACRKTVLCACVSLGVCEHVHHMGVWLLVCMHAHPCACMHVSVVGVAEWYLRATQRCGRIAAPSCRA
jgi:hypothetical protein